MRYKYTEDELRLAVKESFSIAETCRRLNIRPVGGNYKTLKGLFVKWNINTSHFTGKGWNVGLKHKLVTPVNLQDVFDGKVEFRSSYHLKMRMINEGCKDNICENCGITEWLNEPVKLELHHIDGDSTNNKFSNLQMLCPNCHSMTSNFRKGKSALSEKKEVEYRKFREGLTSNGDADPEPSRINTEGAETIHDTPKSKKIYICNECGKEFTGRGKKFCSVECYDINRRKQIPKVFELLNKFKEFKTFIKVGEYYSVTDNTVRKWCKFYGILDMVKR